MTSFTIQPLDEKAMHACRERIDNLTKPIYSLAQLETMAERLAGIVGDAKPNHLRQAVLIVGADHVVDGPQNKAHGISSYEMMVALNDGHTPTQGAASRMGATVHVVNVGLERSTTGLAHIDDVPVVGGTTFFAHGEAMDSAIFDKAWQLGIDYANKLYDEGIQLVALGNVGEHFYVGAMLVSAYIMDCQFNELLDDRPNLPSPAERGSYIWEQLRDRSLSADDVPSLIRRVGGVDIAFLTAFIMQAASQRMAMVYDNELTTCAVMCAVQMDELVKDYVFPSALYNSSLHKAQVEWLGQRPSLHYDLDVAMGLGSTMGLSVIDASMHMLNDMKTFVEASVTAAEDGPGNERQINPTVR